jgi:tRNA(Arg) A34 adenosine deaminase TadA
MTRGISKRCAKIIQMNLNTVEHEEFMDLAINEAKQAKALGDWPFGCVIVKNNLVIGLGRVTEKTGGDITDHAEIRAIKDACKKLNSNNLSDCTVYCTNEPCLMCASAIFQAGIANIAIALSRDDLPHLLRTRKIRIENLVEDLNFQVNIIRGIKKLEMLALFEDIGK